MVKKYLEKPPLWTQMVDEIKDQDLSMVKGIFLGAGNSMDPKKEVDTTILTVKNATKTYKRWLIPAFHRFVKIYSAFKVSRDPSYWDLWLTDGGSELFCRLPNRTFAKKLPGDPGYRPFDRIGAVGQRLRGAGTKSAYSTGMAKAARNRQKLPDTSSSLRFDER